MAIVLGVESICFHSIVVFICSGGLEVSFGFPSLLLFSSWLNLLNKENGSILSSSHIGGFCVKKNDLKYFKYNDLNTLSYKDI